MGGTGFGIDGADGHRYGEQNSRTQHSAGGEGTASVGGGEVTGSGVVDGGGTTGGSGSARGGSGSASGGSGSATGGSGATGSGATHGGVSPAPPTCSANCPIQFPDG